MKIGDKVRFLSETGGGKVAGFPGNNIVLVEDEDGFQIPFPITEVVLIGEDNYATSKLVSSKMAAESKEKGIEPQKSFTGTFNVRIPSDTHSMAVVKAQELGINLNTFVKYAIEEKLQTSSVTLKRKKGTGKQTA